MMNVNCQNLREKIWFALLALFFLLGNTLSAASHPHVYIETATELLINNKGEVTGLKHYWSFDNKYSAFAIVGLDTNKDGKYSATELAPLARENILSLSEFDFFTYQGTKKQLFEFDQPTDYQISYTGEFLELTFVLPLKKPVDLTATTFRFSVYDPEYYIAFLEPKLGWMRLSDQAPPTCLIKEIKPEDPSLQMERLSEADITSNKFQGFGALYAVTHEINCRKKSSKLER